MSYKVTKPGSVCPLSLSLDFLSVVLLAGAPYCIVLFVCSVSWLFLSVQVTDWKTRLRNDLNVLIDRDIKLYSLTQSPCYYMSLKDSQLM